MEDGGWSPLRFSDYPVAEIWLDYARYPHHVFEVHEDSVRRPGIAGFFNLGNTCYYNSNLHVLLSMREFVDYSLTNDCKNSHVIGFELNRFVSELINGRHGVLINGRLRLAIDADHPEYLRPDPIDSVEFFHYFYQTIRRYVPHAPLSLTEFDVVTEAQCAKCGQTVSIGRENALYFLPIEPDVVTWESITDSLPAMIGRWATYTRTDWECPACHCRGGEFHRKILKAPKYLYINNQLDYGEPDEGRFKRAMALNLDTEALHIKSEAEPDVVYRLMSFMNHVGRWAKWGHDISFVRVGGEWITFNDASAVIVPDIRSAVRFGEQYLCLWERVGSH
jgi:ubiquitin C-terminal hydrolase